MNNQCEIVQDLLPLYVDEVCSESSRQLVESHVAGCGRCAAVFARLRENPYEHVLRQETADVIGRHRTAQKKRAFFVGSVMAGILCIPVLVCLIVNLCVGHALDWFFIVLTSLMVFASVTVLPLMLERSRGVFTILGFAGSLLLLLLTCAVYTGGGWFFVAASSVLFGLSVICTPYLVWKLPRGSVWRSHKGLLVMAADTVLLFAMLVCIGFYTAGSFYWKSMWAVAGSMTAFVWLVFLICRYLKTDVLVRVGIVSALVGLFSFSVNNVVNYFLGYPLPWPTADLQTWTGAAVDGNVKWLLLLTGAAAGIILIAAGLVRSLKRR